MNPQKALEIEPTHIDNNDTAPPKTEEIKMEPIENDEKDIMGPPKTTERFSGSVTEPQKRKRQSFTLEQKAQLIAEAEKGIRSKASICREYGIPPGSLHSILNDKANILAAMSSGDFQSQRKKKRTSDFAELDTALHSWYLQAVKAVIKISGPMLQEKGNELAVSLGYTNFKMSQAWIDRFKQRRGISFKSESQNKSSFSIPEPCSDWSTEMRSVFEEYKQCDIYLIDETGLFYQCLPTNQLPSSDDICTNKNIPNKRLTLLIGSNIDGSDKLPILAIGKFEKPRSLISIKTPPLEYRSSEKGWMTMLIFEEWIRKLDKKIAMEGRRVALVLESSNEYLRLKDLNSIKLFFIPPNLKYAMQPRYNGIIKTLKTVYRTKLLRKFLATLTKRPLEDATKSDSFRVSILLALSMVSSSWAQIPSSRIARVFNDSSHLKESTKRQDMTNPELNTLLRLFGRLSNILPLTTHVEHYISVDDNARTIEEHPGDVFFPETSILEEDMNRQTDEDLHVPDTKVIAKDIANKALDVVRLYLQQNNNTSAALEHLNCIETCFGTIDNNSQEKQQTFLDSFIIKKNTH